MKATLSFDLDNSEDSVKHLRAVKSLDLAIAINDILQLRKKEKKEVENEKNTSFQNQLLCT